MAIPHLHSLQSVRVSSSCRISCPNQYHYGRSNFSRKSSSLIYASTSIILINPSAFTKINTKKNYNALSII
ncbi:hypothetical protein ACFX13_030284 [Malus domestica]